MKRVHVPGLLDLFEVNDPAEIKAINEDPRVDRAFDTRTCPFNRFLLKRWLSVLSFEERRFPTMTRRDSPERKLHQQQLSAALQEKAPAIRRGSGELEPLAKWVAGVGPDDQSGILTQQLLGNLFSDQFVATPESWSAAKTLVIAFRSSNYPKMFWWAITGKVRRAQHLLARMVNNDLSAVNAIGIAIHNVVKGLVHMRKLYADASVRATLSPESAAHQCLFAPLNLPRQATADGELNGCPFSRNALFLLEIGEASHRPEGHSLVFMDESWSGCPASEWVPAMFEGLWRRANSDQSQLS